MVPDPHYSDLSLLWSVSLLALFFKQSFFIILFISALADMFFLAFHGLLGFCPASKQSFEEISYIIYYLIYLFLAYFSLHCGYRKIRRLIVTEFRKNNLSS